MIHSKFRINLVPQKTKCKIKKRGIFKFFKLYLEEVQIDVPYNVLKNAVESIRGVKKDLTEKPAKLDKDYYYVLTTKHGFIRFEINYGGKCDIDSEHPPTISVETIPYVADPDFLAEIKLIVRQLVEMTGFKLFFWEALKFLEVKQLYGVKKKINWKRTRYKGVDYGY